MDWVRNKTRPLHLSQTSEWILPFTQSGRQAAAAVVVAVAETVSQKEMNGHFHIVFQV